MNKIKYLLLSLTLILAASCHDDKTEGDYAPPVANEILADKEMRAVWMATAYGIDWPQKEYDAAKQKKMYTDYLDKFVSYNINAVLVQIRPMGDAFYESQYEPWSKEISGTLGKDPAYDVLQFMIEETQARGLEFHAWMNPYRISTKASTDKNFPPLHPKIDSSLTTDYANTRMYNPALPEVRQRIVDIVKEVITKYDVDGIQFDDYFYPAKVDNIDFKDAKEFEKYGQAFGNVADFRRYNVNSVVQDVSKLIKETKPGVLFSISPAPDQTSNYNNLYADITLWCQNEWVDIIIPQLYMSTGGSFKERVNWWPKFSYKAVPMVGYALYKFVDPAQSDLLFRNKDELKLQFQRANLEPKIKGSVMFSAQSFKKDSDPAYQGLFQTLKEMYRDPAVIPFIGRKTVADPSAAVAVNINGATLNWTAAADLRSVVYRIDKTQIRVVAITSEKSLLLKEKGDYFVTTLNRDNTESAISNMVSFK
ncbi:hypothetical protein AwDysgo_04380 [Bacteroidales bacterium]|nr:hypothetical protein AwDysgo_04380 [Bacteroidales bacterium]